MQLLQYDEQTTRTQALNICVPKSGFDYFYLKFITLVSPFRDYGSAKDVKSLNSWFESLTNRFVIFSSGDFFVSYKTALKITSIWYFVLKRYYLGTRVVVPHKKSFISTS